MWITDFTYLHCGEGWVYLVAIGDAHSRRVIGYAMSETQTTHTVIEAMKMAITRRGEHRKRLCCTLIVMRSSRKRNERLHDQDRRQHVDGTYWCVMG